MSEASKNLSCEDNATFYLYAVSVNIVNSNRAVIPFCCTLDRPVLVGFVQDDNHLFAKWRIQGYLKFPWHPYVAPYTGTTLYTVGDDGLIYRHEETWSISALDAARATITPTAGPPAANSA